MDRHQNPLTLICPVRVERLAALYSYLSDMKYDLESGQHEFFDQARNIHYLRWLIIDDKLTYPNSLFFKGDDHAPKLVFSSNFDGSVSEHLKDLSADSIGQSIDLIYGCCLHYPEAEKRNPANRVAYFRKRMVPTAAFYKGSPKRSVVQIQNEKKLRYHLKQLLDTKDWTGMAPVQIHWDLKTEVQENLDFQWLKEETFRMPRTNILNMVLLGIVLFLLLPIIIIWVLIVQYGYEEKDTYYTGTRSDLNPVKTRILEEYEDLGTQKKQRPIRAGAEQMSNADHHDPIPPIFYQNQFSQLVNMKPGKVRLITFKAMMRFARILIPNSMVQGKLMGIPTIHFARWVLFDHNKRVLFFSNFDGSWQQYLGDFIDQSGWGLTGIFSNTAVFPKSRFLGFTGVLVKKKFISESHFLFPGGAYDEEHFLAWSRDSELSTQIWYSAYPELSIKNVNNNSRLRVLFSKEPSERRAKKFFELI